MPGKCVGVVKLEFQHERREYPWDQMEPGDWFDVEVYQHDAKHEGENPHVRVRNSVKTAAKNQSRRTGRVYRTSTRPVGSNCVRVWRVDALPVLPAGVDARNNTMTKYVHKVLGSHPVKIVVPEGADPDEIEALSQEIMHDLNVMDHWPKRDLSNRVVVTNIPAERTIVLSKVLGEAANQRFLFQKELREKFRDRLGVFQMCFLSEQRMRRPDEEPIEIDIENNVVKFGDYADQF